MKKEDVKKKAENLKDKVEDRYRLMEFELENDRLLKKVEQYEREKRRERNITKVDGLSVGFCIVSVFVVMLIMRLAGIGGIGWGAVLTVPFSPIIVDMIVSFCLFLITVVNYGMLRIKQYFYNRRNPPIEF